jgi:hypothetical protein
LLAADIDASERAEAQAALQRFDIPAIQRILLRTVGGTPVRRTIKSSTDTE